MMTHSLMCNESLLESISLSQYRGAVTHRVCKKTKSVCFQNALVMTWDCFGVFFIVKNCFVQLFRFQVYIFYHVELI